jgi:hypothetical protein
MNETTQIIIPCSKDTKHKWIKNSQFYKLKLEDHIIMTMDSLIPHTDSVGIEVIVNGKGNASRLNKRFSIDEMFAAEGYYSTLNDCLDFSKTTLKLIHVDYCNKTKRVMMRSGPTNKKSQTA